MRQIFLRSFPLFIVVLVIFPFVVFGSNTDGTIDSTYKWAWGENIGWINFGTTNGNVHITDSGLSGYALSENVGWIYLNDVVNDGEGNLSGYAWGENVGYINFNPTNGGVIIDSSGNFTGSALGENIGWIIFDSDYTAKTDWRPQSSRPSSGGGAPVASYSPPAPAPPSLESPEGGFKILINDNDKYTNNKKISLKLFAGLNVKKMAISNDPNFSGAGTGQISFENPYSWDLCYLAKECLDGEYTVYVKFYTQYGRASEIVSDKIILDATAPEVQEINIKKYYFAGENIIISGKTEPGAEVIFHWDKKYGSAFANDLGLWKVNLGKLPLGDYVLEVSAKDLIGNRSEFVIFNLIIKELEVPTVPETPEVPEIIPVPEEPEEVITVPEESPITLKGEWDLFPAKSIKGFVLAPLPIEIKDLVKKFPELGETFKKVGITKITDINKLKTIQFTLPSLKDLDKLPTGIVFAKTGDRLIDINIDLSVTEKGKLKQIINTISGKPLQLTIKPESPVKNIHGYMVLSSTSKSLSENSKEIEERLLLLSFEYTDPDSDGIYTAEIRAPLIEGEYEIITVIEFKDPELGRKELRLITVIDPEGYIYEKKGNKETRIPEAVVSLFWLNPETEVYEIWSAEKYQQKNPQITDTTGKYSFLVPEGSYYLEVETHEYLVYKSKLFQVKEGSGIHMNIELKTKYAWLRFFDWKTGLLVLVIILLLYNFYRDKIREKITRHRLK